jgi:exonuclease SbcC
MGKKLKVPKTKRLLFRKEDKQFIPLETSITDIFHLNFDQFCKTVILNQGEFSRFLTSSFGERKEILERLYQGDFLSQIGQTLRAKVNTLTASKQLIDTEVEALKESFHPDIDSIVEEKELKTIKTKELINIQETLKSFESNLNDLKKSNDSKKQYETKKLEVDNQIILKNQNLDKAKVEYEKLEGQFSEFEVFYNEQNIIYQQALETLNKLDLAQQESKHLDDSKNKIERELTQIQQKANESRLQKTNLEAKLRIIRSQSLAIQSNIDKNLLTELAESSLKLDQRKTELKKTKATLTAQLSQLIEQNNERNTDIENVRKSILSLKTKYDNNDLQSYENHLVKTLQETEQKIQRTKEKTSSLSSLHEEYLLYSSQLNIIQDIISNLVIELSENQSLFQKESEIYQSNILKHSIKLCQEEANKKGQCPVCHNDVERIQLISYDEVSKENLDKIRQQLSQIEKNLAIETQKLKNLKENKSKSQEQIKLIYKGLFDKDYDFVTDLTAYCDNHLKELNLSSLKAKQELDEFKVVKSQLDKQLQSLQNLLTEQNLVDKQMQDIESQIVKSTNEITLFKDEETSFIKTLEDKLNFCLIVNRSEYLNEQLEQLTQYNLLEVQLPALENSLKHLKVDYHEKNDEIKEVKGKINKNKDEINAINLELDNIPNSRKAKDVMAKLNEQKDDWHKRKQKQKDEINLKLIALKEQQSKLYNLQEQLAQSKQVIDISTQKIQKFASLVSKVDNELLSDLRKHIKKAIGEFSTEPVIFNSYFEHFTQIYSEYKENFKFLEQRLIQLDIIIENHQKVKSKVESKLTELKKIEKEFTRLDTLLEAIGKDEFRNFVLSYIEEQLIQQTNVELESLCQGRYFLTQIKKRNSVPEFVIIDKLKASARRKISTLSGGETFMVSLAMAMALSELSRGQTDIDSFFIDEGFATLDKESLEDIIDMLHSMRSRGKQIGIISHLEHLTNRLPVNVCLNKNQFGDSQIEVEYH